LKASRHVANGRWSLRGALVALLALLPLGFSGAATANTSAPRNVPATSIGLGSQFTIADFDGDRSPDSASIEPGGASSGNSRYSIDLQLSAAGQQSIQFFAPGGGLTIKARDVNGDHAVDLVLATAWFKQPVAVFLNDGHGGFSRAASGEYPRAFSDADSSWAASSGRAADSAGAPPQQGTGVDAAVTIAWHSPSASRFAVPARAGFPFGASLLSQPERAPPALHLP
jgi:hypothetical protein